MSGVALVVDARRLCASRGSGANALWRMSAAVHERALFARPSSRELAKVIGLLPQASFLPPTSAETGWWKIDAVLDFMASRKLDRVVWLDGELAAFDQRLGVTYREAAEDALADAGITPLLFAPDYPRALNATIAELVEDFAARRYWTPARPLLAASLETAV